MSPGMNMPSNLCGNDFQNANLSFHSWAMLLQRERSKSRTFEENSSGEQA